MLIYSEWTTVYSIFEYRDIYFLFLMINNFIIYYT